ncbi:MAG: aminotransferase class IV [Gammaproteobacteria bacterium AqS3]|nr:aminotransferase class IV [Gammaproteobacteria bacterium AqS3]
MQTGYLNGEYAPLNEMNIPVLDRGVLFADAVYEVVPVFEGRLIALADHHARLMRTAGALKMPPEHLPDLRDWSEIMHRLADGNPGCGGIYYQHSRGVEPARALRPASDDLTPTRLGFALASLPPSGGVRARLIEDQRWGRCDLKTTGLIGNLLGLLAADGEEVVLQRDGWVTESSTSNVFVVLDGAVHTPKADQRILHGITRALAIQVGACSGWPVTERDISVDELGRADEIWLTSSLRAISAVTHLDGTPVGDGAEGALCRRAREDLLRRYRTDSQA